MEANAFIAEVYHRMALRNRDQEPKPTFEQISSDSRVLMAEDEYRALLPSNKMASILDIGFGGGWFLAACLKLGYRNLNGADFQGTAKGYIQGWSPDSIHLYDIETNIGDFLSSKPAEYDVIHMSHVIEHVPKYSLLWVVDALYRSLKPGGMALLRAPNMEGPAANSCYYVTLGHEYGFAGSNLKSLLHICGFDNITFHGPKLRSPTLKQRLGILLRWPYLLENRVRHRLFGVNVGRCFGDELFVTGTRGNFEPLFDPKFR